MQGEGAPKERRELLHALPKFHDFLLEFRCRQVRHIQAHYDLRGVAEPPPDRRARDPEIGGRGHVPFLANDCLLHAVPEFNQHFVEGSQADETSAWELDV